MEDESVIFIGVDYIKAEDIGGDISSEPASVASMINKLSKRGAKLHFC
nr:hypothetical protein [Rhizobium ruizarguesonis]